MNGKTALAVASANQSSESARSNRSRSSPAAQKRVSLAGLAISDPLAKIANANPQDKWTRLAVASAVGTRSGALLAKVQDPLMLRDLATIVGSRRDPAEVSTVVAGLEKAPGARRTAVLNGLAEGMARRLG